MSKAKPYDEDSLERALIHHGVKYRRPDPPSPGLDGRSRRGKWFIHVHDGRDMTEREVFAFLAGFKLARDKWELKVSTGPRRREPERERCRNHSVAESFCNECGR